MIHVNDLGRPSDTSSGTVDDLDVVVGVLVVVRRLLPGSLYFAL